MQSIVTVVARSVYLLFSLLVMTVSPAKMAEPIEMLFVV